MTKTEFAAEAESIARDYANVTLLRDRDGAPLTNGDRECLLTLTDARVNPEMLEDLKRRASNLPAETSAGDYVLTLRYSDYDHDHEIGRFYDWLS